MSWAGPATRVRGAAEPPLPICAGARDRRVAVGYLRAWSIDPPGHVEALAARLRAFAHQHGLVLADVYVEQPDVSSREGAAFSALVEALRRPRISTVVIPADHFCRFGGRRRAIFPAIVVETGADVLIMSNSGGGAW